MIDDIFVLHDLEALSHKAASLFISSSRGTLSSKEKFFVAVPGGATPLRFFTLLGSTYRNEVEWNRTEFFWVDERCVPIGHEDSNFKGAYDSLLSNVPIPDVNIHRIRGDLNPEEGAYQYENELKKTFRQERLPEFDLVILGMGSDGHVASLFPNSASLTEKERPVIPIYVDKLRSWRITLTLPVLNNSSTIIFLVSGEIKAKMLSEMLASKDRRERYPAGLIRPEHGAIIWLVDKAAASRLSSNRFDLCKLIKYFL